MALNSTVTPVNPPASQAAADTIVLQALQDALSAWSNYISGIGTLSVDLSFSNLGSPNGTAPFIIASASPSAYDFSAANSAGAILPNAAQDVLATGNQIAGRDIQVTFNADLLPTITSESSYSLVSVMEHELEHGFGLSGFLGENAPVPESNRSRYDALVQITPNGSEYFTGAAAERVYGGPVPLTTQVSGSDNYHLGATGTSADGSLFTDLMAPFLYPGATITPLDVAILSDLGLQLTTAGEVFVDPYATLTAATTSTGGRTVTDPQIFGMTQPNEVVTITVGSTVLGTTVAGKDGNWSFRASGLTDGTYALVASVPTLFGTAIYGAVLNLDATTPVINAFQQILGRQPNAANIANLRVQLVNGTTLATIRTSIASGPEATSDINAAFFGALGRAARTVDLWGWQTTLALGSSLTDLHAALASSPEAAAAIENTYMTTLGRAASAADLAGWQANLAVGETLSQLRTILGGSPEAQAAINAAYVGELGRAATASDVQGWSVDLQNGTTLAYLHTQLGLSSESVRAIANTYQAVLGRPAQAADLAGWQLNFETGQTLTTLRTILAGSGEAATDITTAYQNELGRTPNATEIASAQQLLAGNSLSAVDASLATGSEAQSDLATSLQSALGHAPDPLQIAGGESELLSGFTLSQVQGQIAALGAGNVSPIVTSVFAPITPDTIQGMSGTQMVYGLPDNVVADLSASTSVTVTKTLGGDTESIDQFNPTTDFLLIPAKFVSGGFASLQSTFFDFGGGTALNFRQGSAGTISGINLDGVHPAQLTTANFHFV